MQTTRQSSQHEQPFARDQVSKHWRPVLQNGYKYKKPVFSNRQLITLSNRFTPLSDAQGPTVLTEAITPDTEETSKGGATYNKKP